ncbi:UvrD-helicase domain-containing protein [Methanohalophilus halophilus]|nr:ATP-dependent helicase [Methanohalophilus halophilus]APH38217.1 hypothetical protein BHR79_01105 [Methanohalophilus halophilus]SDV99654.1 Superfamily I DNA or RNA helicase [Methanohalophilus halophilus]
MSNLAIWGAPGTGKTSALIEKYLQKSGKKLIVTFSRSTADDIRKRLSDLNGEEVTKDEVNTIHGTCNCLLAEKKNVKLMKPNDYKRFENDTGNKLSKPTHDETEPSKSRGLVDCWGWMQNTGTPYKKITKFPGWKELKIPPSQARKVIKDFQQWKLDNDKINFTDMLVEVLRHQLIPDCDVLLVDEFQDLTALQFKIIKLWSENIDTVIIAGDPLQSIYGFWGGSPEYFKQFDSEQTVLDKSYRLPAAIWEYACGLANRYNMDIPKIDTTAQEGKIDHLNYKQYLAHKSFWKGNKNFKVFHLVRSNYQAARIAHEMAREGILWAGISGWTKQEIIVLNILIMAKHGIEKLVLSKSDILAMLDQFPVNYFSYGGSKKSIKAAIEEEQYRDDYGPLFVGDSLYKILESPNPVNYMSNPSDLKYEKFQAALEKYAEEVTWSEAEATVLTTIHGSKGLEADRVFLHTGISNKIKKEMRKDPAEEARVFYVGITRSKEELIVVKDKGKNFPLTRRQ